MRIWISVLASASLALWWMSASAQDYLQGRVTQNQPPETMAERYVESQAQLLETYQELLDRLDQTGRVKLEVAQKAWRTFSVAECDFKIHRSAAEARHPMSYNECLIGMNTERTADLENELQWHQLLTPGS